MNNDKKFSQTGTFIARMRVVNLTDIYMCHIENVVKVTFVKIVNNVNGKNSSLCIEDFVKY